MGKFKDLDIDNQNEENETNMEITIQTLTKEITKLNQTIWYKNNYINYHKLQEVKYKEEITALNKNIEYLNNRLNVQRVIADEKITEGIKWEQSYYEACDMLNEQIDAKSAECCKLETNVKEQAITIAQLKQQNKELNQTIDNWIEGYKTIDIKLKDKTYKLEKANDMILQMKNILK